ALSTAEIWTNAPGPPPSGLMKPYPFVALNHFTVPHCHFKISLKQKERLDKRDSLVDLAAIRRQKAVAESSQRRLSVIIVNTIVVPAFWRASTTAAGYAPYAIGDSVRRIARASSIFRKPR